MALNKRKIILAVRLLFLEDTLGDGLHGAEVQIRLSLVHEHGLDANLLTAIILSSVDPVTPFIGRWELEVDVAQGHEALVWGEFFDLLAFVSI